MYTSPLYMNFCMSLFGVGLLKAATAWELILWGFHLDVAAVWASPLSIPPRTQFLLAFVSAFLLRHDSCNPGSEAGWFFCCFKISESGILLCVILTKFGFQTRWFATISQIFSWGSSPVRCDWIPLNLLTTWVGKMYLWSKLSCNKTSRGAQFSTIRRWLEENLHIWVRPEVSRTFWLLVTFFKRCFLCFRFWCYSLLFRFCA